MIVNSKWTDEGKAKNIKAIKTTLRFVRIFYPLMGLLLLYRAMEFATLGTGYLNPFELVGLGGLVIFSWWVMEDSSRYQLCYINNPEEQRKQGFKTATWWGKHFPGVAAGWMWKLTMKNSSPGYKEGYQAGLAELKGE